MNAGTPSSGLPFARTVALHSLGWLVAANLVGVWLGVSLVWPAAGDLIAPLTYGRWVPLHLAWQLYGWCALPLVGALLAWCLDAEHPRVDRHARTALGAWSLALALGGVAWLGGTTSGKLFQDWYGWTRPLLPAAMYVVWALLMVHTWRRWQLLTVAGRVWRGVLLFVLLVVPSLLYWSSARGVYPSVNPDSGGATGAALLGSTLGIVTIYLMLPSFLGLASRRRAGTVVWPLIASWLVFAVTDRGNASHHAIGQMASLGLLILWIPLLPFGWSRFVWPEETRIWLRAASAWWTLLVLSGWITFLPGVSEALKFTHGLVAHSHLAMAGFVTSMNGAIVIVLTKRSPPRDVFWLWQAGCGIFVAVMLVLGGLEAERADELFRSEAWTQLLLAVRLAAGVAMTVASGRWLADNFRR